ncbi:MAG: BON domain-containing protein [Chloroflexota bacterium]
MQPTERRPDVDIEEEIEALTRSFAPLKASRGYFTAKSVDGHVKVVGNVRSPQARQVLLDNIPNIKGVVSCEGSELYDDEMIRFAVGQLLPPGVVAGVHYGAVALTGKLPEGVQPDTITKAASGVKGVKRVVTDFNTSTDDEYRVPPYPIDGDSLPK